MRKTLLIAALFLSGCVLGRAAELQGVVVDWNCVKPMVKDGREKTLRNNRNCSLMHNYRRSAYGIITVDKKFYRLDDQNNDHVLQLLQGTPDKDDLKVIVTGDIAGDAIKVATMSLL
ncbi:MAG: hypothetical protein JO319_21355 [Acidobacteriaceae bacterium]|nr:hypothetical protein [Acidobacteriaceae bacterium]